MISKFQRDRHFSSVSVKHPFWACAWAKKKKWYRRNILVLFSLVSNHLKTICLFINRNLVLGDWTKWQANTYEQILRKRCPYLEFFRPPFSRIRTEGEEIRSMSPYSVWMWENADQNKSQCGQFLRSGMYDA